MSRDARFEEQAQALGYRFDGEIKIGGNYVPLVRDGHHIYLSGQIPRVGDTVVVTGAAGAGASLADAQKAAKVCAMRALALLQRALGSLDAVQSVLRITVYVQSAHLHAAKRGGRWRVGGAVCRAGRGRRPHPHVGRSAAATQERDGRGGFDRLGANLTAPSRLDNIL